MRENVAVGMSGGIDSLVTALLLQREGYAVTGVHLRMEEGEEDLSALERNCRRLDIPFVVYAGGGLFRTEVVESFVAEYLEGHTPCPCCFCNSSVKWRLLEAVADKLGIGRIATGHYVRIREEKGFRYVCKGVDPVKDQSYFLWGMGQEILARALAPLGDYTKEEVRRIAVANGYGELVGRRESMGVCFLHGRDYRDFLEEKVPGAFVPGKIVDRRGHVIGNHPGIHRFTVGQKRGMPQDVAGRQLYVAGLDAGRNEVVADLKETLWTRELRVKDWHVVRMEDLEPEGLEVKVRGLGQNPEGGVEELETDGRYLRIRLEHPAWAVAPGQPAVLYRGEKVVGGGILC